MNEREHYEWLAELPMLCDPCGNIIRFVNTLKVECGNPDCKEQYEVILRGDDELPLLHRPSTGDKKEVYRYY